MNINTRGLKKWARK